MLAGAVLALAMPVKLARQSTLEPQALRISNWKLAVLLEAKFYWQQAGPGHRPSHAGRPSCLWRGLEGGAAVLITA